MIVKVCGLIEETNLVEVTNLNIDMIGLNFYKPSKRYLGEKRKEFNELIPSFIAKVGVFVNEELDKVLELAEMYNLDMAQLHGSESMEYCKVVQNKLKVIKAFGIEEKTQIDKVVKGYENCDYLLFDTKSPQHGGTGRKFDWNTLKTYTKSSPFLLSGGIGPTDHQDILDIDHPAFSGVDINSKFESEPGVKIVEKVSSFVDKIKSR
jgi:phosphoribosylanthranilate isomerase